MPLITKGLALLFRSLIKYHLREAFYDHHISSSHEDHCSTPIILYPFTQLCLSSLYFPLCGITTHTHTHMYVFIYFYFILVISANVSSRKDFDSLVTVILRALEPFPVHNWINTQNFYKLDVWYKRLQNLVQTKAKSGIKWSQFKLGQKRFIQQFILQKFIKHLLCIYIASLGYLDD